MELGNFGDPSSVETVWELRINLGPGYRLYYALKGTNIVILLCRGDKGSQGADIDRACDYWRDVLERSRQ